MAHCHRVEIEPWVSEQGVAFRNWAEFGGDQPVDNCPLCADGVPYEVDVDDEHHEDALNQARPKPAPKG